MPFGLRDLMKDTEEPRQSCHGCPKNGLIRPPEVGHYFRHDWENVWSTPALAGYVILTYCTRLNTVLDVPNV